MTVDCTPIQCFLPDYPVNGKKILFLATEHKGTQRTKRSMIVSGESLRGHGFGGIGTHRNMAALVLRIP